MFFSETKIRVRYADTDQMQMVYYGKYFEYFEQGRSDLLRSIDMPYSLIEKKGIFLPAIEAYANYIYPARFDDLLVVKTILLELPSSTIRIEYEIKNSERELILVTGYTQHCFINASNGKPTRAPNDFIKKIEHAFRTFSPIQ
ncbi:MAG: thioesterase family protein [Bacteroidota bacterium]